MVTVSQALSAWLPRTFCWFFLLHTGSWKSPLCCGKTSWAPSPGRACQQVMIHLSLQFSRKFSPPWLSTYFVSSYSIVCHSIPYHTLKTNLNYDSEAHCTKDLMTKMNMYFNGDLSRKIFCETGPSHLLNLYSHFPYYLALWTPLTVFSPPSLYF